uniref:DNA polymerase delta subunit 3 n=1 Tax=Rhodnius prolixus TaxID=13249 RepID=T1HYW5_RHOPR
MNGVLEDHLQSIEDFVLVEDKIVTYKWLSKALKVHINTAKQLLHAFTTKKEYDKKLLVTYLISGEEKCESGKKFCLVNKAHLDSVKQSLKKVSCEHVYSVQRNNNFDTKDLYNADCTYELTEEDRKLCSIQKNVGDIVKKQRKSEDSIVPADSVNDTSSKGQHKIGTQNKLEKTVNTSNFQKNTESKLESTKPLQEKNAPNKCQSIGMFFNKQAASAAISKKQSPKDVVVDKEIEEAKENILGTNNKRLSSDDKDNSQEDDGIIKLTPVSKKRENTKKRKKHDKEYESANKRRKRIMVASDSESSSSEFDEERSPSPEPEPIPALVESEDEIIPPTPVEKGRKRVKKQVDRTFTDKDGFILTIKEDVFESCTDDEAPSENKKETKDNKSETNTNKPETNDNRNSKDDQKAENNKNNVMKKSSPKKTLSNNKKSPKKTPSNNKKSSPKKTPPKNKQQSIRNFFKKK